MRELGQTEILKIAITSNLGIVCKVGVELLWSYPYRMKYFYQPNKSKLRFMEDSGSSVRNRMDTTNKAQF
jgi:hypothetical protein